MLFPSFEFFFIIPSADSQYENKNNYRKKAWESTPFSYPLPFCPGHQRSETGLQKKIKKTICPKKEQGKKIPPLPYDNLFKHPFVNFTVHFHQDFITQQQQLIAYKWGEHMHIKRITLQLHF